MNLVEVVAVLAGLVVVSLLCRELWCWYWKINEQLAVLRSIDKSLAVLASTMAPKKIAHAVGAPMPLPSGHHVTCWFCGERPAEKLLGEHPICGNCITSAAS
jgi:hypothetical protein